MSCILLYICKIFILLPRGKWSLRKSDAPKTFFTLASGFSSSVYRRIWHHWRMPWDALATSTLRNHPGGSCLDFGRFLSKEPWGSWRTMIVRMWSHRNRGVWPARIVSWAKTETHQTARMAKMAACRHMWAIVLEDLNQNPNSSRSGWWFGPFFIFPYIGNNNPIWLSYFSEG